MSGAPGMAAIHLGTGAGYYQHSDWLGSSRFGVAGGTGAVQYDRQYAPFGEVYDELGSNTQNRAFTGQSEDTAQGLNDFQYRQYSPSQGRWLVPDPAGMAAVDITIITDHPPAVRAAQTRFFRCSRAALRKTNRSILNRSL